MPNIGIICELNPFHNGHQQIFSHARTLAGADGNVIAIMSGNFVQRGDVAIVDKWVRTRMALSCGADVVIEIPPIFAAASAQYFAQAAVAIANALGCVDYLLFGSETGDLDSLSAVDPTFGGPITASSYAREMEQHLGFAPDSNDILAIEYLKALSKTKSTIKPIAFMRVGSPESSVSTDSLCPSALSLRILLNSHRLADVEPSVPAPCFALLKDAITSYGCVPTIEYLSSYIFGLILTLHPEGLEDLPGVSEGLEYKIYNEVAYCGPRCLKDLTERCVSKRYTRSRIRRILVGLVTGSTKTLLANSATAPFIRILGIRAEKTSFIKCINNKKETPVIVGNIPADYESLFASNPEILTHLRALISSTDLYGLCFENPDFRKAGKEFSTPLIKI